MTGVFRGGGEEEGSKLLFLQGFDPLPTQRVPLCTLMLYRFLMKDPKTLLKVPSPIYTKFEGERAPKKRNFLVKIWVGIDNANFEMSVFEFMSSKTIVQSSEMFMLKLVSLTIKIGNFLDVRRNQAGKSGCRMRRRATKVIVLFESTLRICFSTDNCKTQKDRRGIVLGCET